MRALLLFKVSEIARATSLPMLSHRGSGCEKRVDSERNHCQYYSTLRATIGSYKILNYMGSIQKDAICDVNICILILGYYQAYSNICKML